MIITRGSRDAPDRAEGCSPGLSRLIVSEEFGTGPNVMDLLLFRAIALRARLRQAILVPSSQATRRDINASISSFVWCLLAAGGGGEEDNPTGTLCGRYEYSDHTLHTTFFWEWGVNAQICSYLLISCACKRNIGFAKQKREL